MSVESIHFSDTPTLSPVRQGDVAFQARLYDDPNPTRRSLHRARKAWVERRLDLFVHRGERVLEVGVGCGLFTAYLSAKGALTTAADINQSFLDGVADLPGVSVQHGDATIDLGFRDFDAALCTEVIEHVPPPRSQALLNEFFRALKPGGVLVLTTPQRFSLLEIVARSLRFGPVLALARRLYGSADDLGHINLLTRRALRRQIEVAGFRISECEVFGLYLPGVAEFGGRAGATFQASVGRFLQHVPVARSLLWTQAYVLKKPTEQEGDTAE